MSVQDREHRQRDWFILLPILLLGILLMQAAGFLAIRFIASWELRNVNMDSMINPDGEFPAGQSGPGLAPLNPEILTPFAWEKILTPQDAANATVVPIIIFKPVGTATATAGTSPTSIASASSPTSLPATATLPPSTSTSVPIIIYPTQTQQNPTRTPRPNPTDTDVPPPATFTLTFTPTETPTVTVTVTPTVTPTITETQTPSETPTETSTPTSTPGTGGVVVAPPDGSITTIGDGNSALLTLSTPIITGDPGTYDLVHYEREAPGVQIMMDCIEIRIANDLAGPWYTIFMWGDGASDDNTNVSMNTYGYTEYDDEPIPMSTLYGSPIQTGILIDADVGAVPAASYQYLLIFAPVCGGDGQTDVDSIEILP